MELRRLQALFWQLLTAPEGAARGAAELRRRGEIPHEDLAFLVKAGSGPGPVERLDIYADMYFYRLRDCLAEDFPALAARIGPARFHNLVTDYLLAHPSTHFSLRELGRALPGFVAGHALEAAYPGLGDLARLEWARVDVFDAEDPAPLDRDALLASASRPGELGLMRVPASRLLRLDASVLPLWKRLGADPAAPVESALAGERRGVLVWRRGFAIHHRSLDADEERGLVALGSGASVAELGERLLEAMPPDTPATHAARRLAELLERWAADGLLCRGPDTGSRAPAGPGAR